MYLLDTIFLTLEPEGFSHYWEIPLVLYLIGLADFFHFEIIIGIRFFLISAAQALREVQADCRKVNFKSRMNASN